MARLKNKEFKIEELTAEIQKAIDSDQETIRLKAVAAKLGADPPTSNPRPSPDPQSAGVPGWVWIVGVLLGVLTLNALYNKRWVTAGVWTAVILGLYFYWPSLQQTSRSVFQGSGAPYYLGSPTATIKPVTLSTDMAPKVKAAADKYGVPENLMAGVCWQESRCNPNVRDGSAGEIGPMQIMPSTAGGYGVDAKSLRDPDTNLDTGARVLKDCLNVVPGRLDLAVLCYNAGSDKAKKYATTPWSQIPPHELRGTRDGKPYDSHAYVTSVLNFTSSGGVGPGAVLAATPTTLSELSITVPSSAESGVMVLDQAGQPLVVQAGDTIEIIASNQVNIGRGLVDADGERGYADNSVDSPFKDRVGGLEMWIGPSKQANRYFAGKQFRHIVAHSGTVTLRVIESVRGYHDGNTGAFNVLVRKSPKEAS